MNASCASGSSASPPISRQATFHASFRNSRRVYLYRTLPFSTSRGGPVSRAGHDAQYYLLFIYFCAFEASFRSVNAALHRENTPVWRRPHNRCLEVHRILRPPHRSRSVGVEPLRGDRARTRQMRPSVHRHREVEGARLTFRVNESTRVPNGWLMMLYSDIDPLGDSRSAKV